MTAVQSALAIRRREAAKRRSRVGLFANEAAVKKRICKHLRMAGAWVTMPHQRGFSQKGVPDILACYKGRFLGIEVKYNGNTTSEFQDIQLNKIEAAGGISLVLDETNWRLILLWLQHVGE